jgi:hypothetical protein
MSEASVVLRFENLTADEANKAAASLMADIQDGVPEVRVARQRDNDSTMDFGPTLVLVLGSPAVVMLAHKLGQAVASWAKRTNSGSVTIEPGGRVVVRNVDSKDAAAIAKAISGK